MQKLFCMYLLVPDTLGCMFEGVLVFVSGDASSSIFWAAPVKGGRTGLL
jgi:hypothetical protein